MFFCKDLVELLDILDRILGFCDKVLEEIDFSQDSYT